jgi:hypothetical protein
MRPKPEWTGPYRKWQDETLWVNAMREWQTELVQTLVGHTITAVEIEGSERHHSQCRLTLSDGRVIEFVGWGYDEWGLSVEEVEPT